MDEIYGRRVPRDGSGGKRIAKKFTDNAIRELPVEGRDRLVFERMTPGFGVRVTPAGKKIFLAQAPRQAGAKRTSVGVFPDKLVADARQDARQS
jgi:hypothetical protein